MIRKNDCSKNDIVLLLKNCVSVHKTARDLAMRLVSYHNFSASIIFPSIFYSKTGLATILDLVGALHLESANEYSSSPKLHLPHSKETLMIPSSRVLIKEIYEFIEKYIKDTLSKALCQAPRRVLSAFAYYVYTSNKIVKNSLNSQFGYITNYGISKFNHYYYSSNVIPIQKFHLLRSYLFPDKFHLWFLQQKPSDSYFLRDEPILQLQGNYLSIADSLIESQQGVNDLVLILKGFCKENNQNSEVSNVLGKIAAMMVILNKNDFFSEILQVPLIINTITSIKAGIFCWEWLSSSLSFTKPLLYLELQLGLKEYLFSNNFFLEHKPFSRNLTLINCTAVSKTDISEKLEKIALIIGFIQQQIYSFSKEENIKKIFKKIIDSILEEKLNPEALNYEAGVEAMLTILLFTLDLLKFFPSVK